MEKKFLTVEDVAKRYGFSISTVLRKAKSGEMPQGMKIGRSRRWSVDELEEFERSLGKEKIEINTNTGALQE